MNRKSILLLFLYFFSFGNSNAQCNFSLLPNGELCSEALYMCGNELHGFTGRLPLVNTSPLPWVGLCEYSGSAENMVWFAFTPCSNQVTLRITPSNCANNAGIQAGLYRRCGGDFSVACSVDPVPAIVGQRTTFDISWNNFIPGRTAYLVLDGMAGDICDFTIEVIEGIDTSPAMNVDASLLQDGFVVGPDKIECKDSRDTMSYSMVMPTCLMNYVESCFLEKINILDSVCFVWNVDNLGGGSYYFVDNDSVGTDVKIVFNGAGSDQFRIRVDVNIHPYYGGGCAKGACGIVRDLLVVFEPDELITEVIDLCPGNVISICNTTITEDTVIECEDPSNPCRKLRYDVRVKPLRTNPMGTVYQCTGSYFEFQGTRYYNTGNYMVPDNFECDLIHQFEVRNVVMNVMVNNGIRQLDCTNETINLTTSIVSDFANDVKYEWIYNNTIVGTGASLIVSSPGRYSVRAYIDNNIVNCQSIDFADITLNKEKPICSFNSPVLNCSRKSGHITYTSNSPLVNESWSTPAGNTVNGVRFMIDSLFASSGLSCRFRAIRADNGCAIDTLISVQSDFVAPKVSISGDGELTCVVNKIPLEVNVDMTWDSIRWIRDGNFLIANSNVYDATVPGNYTCWMRATRNGCTSDGSKKILEDRVSPRVELGDNQLWYCNTTEVTLNPTVDRGDNFQYQWLQRNGGEINGSLISPDVTFIRPGLFYLQVSNRKNGCQKTDSLFIELNEDVPENILANVRNPLCFGEINGSIENIEIQGGFEPYILSVNGQTINVPEINNLKAGTYEITVQDKYECEYSLSFILDDPELLTVDPIDDITVSFNETSNLEVFTNYDDSEILSITWRDAGGNIVGSGYTYYFDQLTSQTYEVEVINLNGCSVKTRVKVIVDSEVKFIISNVLKFGGNFGNNQLVIRKNNVPADILSLYICDRWGSKIYEALPFSMNGAETKEIDIPSEFNGRELQQGVYVLFIQYRDYFGKQNIITSDLTILK